MITLKNTKENKTYIEILKQINQTKWVGNTVHEDLDKCLTAINLMCMRNSGWYNPTPIRIKGLTGIYIINEDGSLLYDYRVIKEDNGFKIETLSTGGYNDFERMYNEKTN